VGRDSTGGNNRGAVGAGRAGDVDGLVDDGRDDGGDRGVDGLDRLSRAGGLDSLSDEAGRADGDEARGLLRNLGHDGDDGALNHRAAGGAVSDGGSAGGDGLVDGLVDGLLALGVAGEGDTSKGSDSKSETHFG